MKLFDFIEQVIVISDHICNDTRYIIHDQFSHEEWIRAARLFSKSFTRECRIPLETQLTFRGIIDYYHQNHTMSHRQSLYLMHVILDYWSEMSLEIRGLVVSC
jgi:hypothetical protein